MTIERVAVVDCYELEDAIKNHFDLEELDILRMFFEEASNDSYQCLCIDEGSVEVAYRSVELYTEWGYDETRIEELKMKAQILEYLHKKIPNEEMILVSISW